MPWLKKYRPAVAIAIQHCKPRRSNGRAFACNVAAMHCSTVAGPTSNWYLPPMRMIVSGPRLHEASKAIPTFRAATADSLSETTQM